MSLLTIIQTVATRLSLARPSTVVNSNDEQVLQLFSLALEEGDELATLGWQSLQREKTFVTVAAAEQTNSTNDDFGHCIQDTTFNRTQSRKMVGPISPQDWQAIQALGGVQPNDNLFRIRGNVMLITPTPSAGDTIAYEYVSRYWAKSDADVAKAYFTSDTDETYLDEQLMIQGIRWRYKAAKGLDYAEDMATYERNKARKLAQEGGMMAVSLTRRDEFPGRPNIPQTIPV